MAQPILKFKLSSDFVVGSKPSSRTEPSIIVSPSMIYSNDKGTVVWLRFQESLVPPHSVKSQDLVPHILDHVQGIPFSFFSGAVKVLTRSIS